MTDFPNRQQLYEDLINARQELKRSVLFLTGDETRQPGVDAEWCVRDVFSHMTGREATLFAAVRNLVTRATPVSPTRWTTASSTWQPSSDVATSQWLR